MARDRTETPLVTAVLCTRDRGSSITRAAEAVLRNDGARFEVWVVDQSEDDSTERAMKPYLDDARFNYLRTATRGLSVSRNLGISRARGEYIAMTDDDCEPSSNWLSEVIRAFSVDDRIAVVFGNVLPAPHNSSDGFIPACVRQTPVLARSLHEKHCVEGMGACLAVRRAVWERLDGFDEMLGGGARFKSAEELDFAIRALLAGYFIYETPRVSVVHHGFRTWEQGRDLVHNYWYGTGAVFCKHLRLGSQGMAHLLRQVIWRWAFGVSPVAESLGAHSHRWLRLAAFAKGFVTGAVTPVEKATRLFAAQKPGR